jgi:hypothetical protein
MAFKSQFLICRCCLLSQLNDTFFAARVGCSAKTISCSSWGCILKYSAATHNFTRSCQLKMGCRIAHSKSLGLPSYYADIRPNFYYFKMMLLGNFFEWHSFCTRKNLSQLSQLMECQVTAFYEVQTGWAIVVLAR